MGLVFAVPALAKVMLGPALATWADGGGSGRRRAATWGGLGAAALAMLLAGSWVRPALAPNPSPSPSPNPNPDPDPNLNPHPHPNPSPSPDPNQVRHAGCCAPAGGVTPALVVGLVVLADVVTSAVRAGLGLANPNPNPNP